MSSSLATFLFEAANFLLLAGVLGWFFFRPVRDALERRRGELESEQRAAVDARAAAERALQDARAQRDELESSLEELRRRGQREAESEREEVVEAARVQTQRERAALKREIVSLRRAQARSLVRDAAFAAREIVVRLLQEIEGPDLDNALLRTACRELEKLRSSGPLAPVILESALALENATLVAIAQAVGLASADVAHRVDPDLAVGFRILTARGLVDVSAAGLATQVERVLVSQLELESSDHG